MKIGTSGVLVNGFGRVLLMQRDDTRTFAAPGGGLEQGELPTEGLVRELREETGVLAIPVRLAALTYWRQPPEGHLFFIFRCLQRGGEPQPTAEAISVGYYPIQHLPRLMARMHRERLDIALHNQREGTLWQEHQTGWQERLGWAIMQGIVYPLKNWQLRRKGQEPPVPAPRWKTEAYVVLRDEKGHVLWLNRADGWYLPGGEREGIEAPWETAVRQTQQTTGLTIQLDKLAVVNVYQNQAHMTFTFTAHAANSPTAAHLAYFPPSSPPPNASPQHVERVADAFNGSDATSFRLQKG